MRESTSPEKLHWRHSVVGPISLVLVALAVFGLAFVPLRGSQDEWWHLKAGQWIWEHGRLPVNDIFTYTGENMRWYNHEWLSQVIFYNSYRVGEWLGGDGLFTFILFKSIVVAGAFLLVARLARQRGVSWPTAAVIALIAADVSRRTIYPRPPIFSYLLLAAFLLLLYGWKRGQVRSRWLWVLVPATVLWANMHGMVLLAFVAAGAFAGGELLENVRRWWVKSKTCPAVPLHGIFSKQFWMLTALTAALVLAAMAQPSGYHLFFLGRNFTADPLLQQIILEMKPTPGALAIIDGNLPWWKWDNLAARPPGFWTPWMSLVIILALLVRNRLRLPYGADYLLLAFFTYQGFMHWRLLPLFAVTAAGPAASLIAAGMSRRADRERSYESPAALALLVGLIAWFNFIVAEPPPETFFRRNLQMLRGETMNLSDYPVPLMDYIIEADLPKQMFSDSNYCGYAMWRLAPEHYKLFTDNRFDVFGSEFIRKERAVFYAAHKGDVITYEPGSTEGQLVEEDWDDVLKRYGVNFIVFRPIDGNHWRLHEALLASGEWQLVYYFVAPGAVRAEWPMNGFHVWVRKSAAAGDLGARSAAIFERHSPGQPAPARLEQMMREASSSGHGGPTDGASSGADWKIPI